MMKFKIKISSDIVIICLVVFVFLVALASLWLVVEKKLSHVQNLVKEESLNDEKRKNLGNLQTTVRSLEAEKALVDEFIIKEGEILSFIEEIEALSGPAGVEVAIESAQQGDEVVLVVRSSGRFSSLYRLVGMMENMNHPVFIEKADFSFIEGNIWDITITVRLLLAENIENEE